MADAQKQDRFVQKAEGVEITNIPPAVLAFIQKQKEEEAKKPNNQK